MTLIYIYNRESLFRLGAGSLFCYYSFLEVVLRHDAYAVGTALLASHILA
jgi:hypothetical protein